MNGLLLALDTTSDRCSACVWSDGRVLARAEPEIGRGHAERLMDVIADVLAEAGARYGDLALIAVAVGPGSFAGLRVGVSAARGLALALDIPAVGVGNLEALAASHGAVGGPTLAVLDARRGELYAQLFDSRGGPVSPPMALSPEALPALVAGVAGSTLALVGSGADIAARALAGRPLAVLSRAGCADIESIARIGDGRGPGAAPRPLYLRGADAKPQAGSDRLRQSGTSAAGPAWAKVEMAPKIRP